MIRINLLPRERVRRPAIASRLLVLILIGAVLAGVVLPTIALNARKKAVESEIARVNDEIKVLESKVSRVEDLRKRIEAARRKEQVLRRLEAARVPWAPVLEELRAIVPKDIWLNQVAARDEGDLVFGGYGTTYEAVARFMVNLEASTMFEGVDLNITQKQLINSREVVNFSVIARLSPGRKEAIIR